MTITDADRKAAEEFITGCDLRTLGRYEQYTAQAFARHREAARREALEEAKAIVDNIRDNAAADGDDANAAAITNAVRSICDHLSVSIANLINKESTNEQ